MCPVVGHQTKRPVTLELAGSAPSTVTATVLWDMMREQNVSLEGLRPTVKRYVKIIHYEIGSS